MRASPSLDDATALWQRRVRLVVLLEGAAGAGLTPLPVTRLHLLAYFANVLAPAWDLPPLDGKVLKRRTGAFYPLLQRDLDDLVGTGVVSVHHVAHTRGTDGRWRLEGEYSLNPQAAFPILSVLRTFDDERVVLDFARELALAVSSFPGEVFDAAADDDASYADPVVGFGNVLDFGEWKDENYSAAAARLFDQYLPAGSPASPGERLHFYAHHLQTRVQRRHA
jgi:hypothetical protein